MEHEEDPGLGAEIEQNYFKNQFKYKPFEKIKAIEVVKEPLPSEYFDALEGRVEKEAAAEVMKEYSDRDIYALTGATISSAAVSTGVKGITKKFCLPARYPGQGSQGTADCCSILIKRG